MQVFSYSFSPSMFSVSAEFYTKLIVQSQAKCAHRFLYCLWSVNECNHWNCSLAFEHCSLVMAFCVFKGSCKLAPSVKYETYEGNHFWNDEKSRIWCARTVVYTTDRWFESRGRSCCESGGEIATGRSSYSRPTVAVLAALVYFQATWF